jgi:hypothetical protein
VWSVVALQPSGLEVAKLVFSFYLVGGMGDAASNPYYTGLDSCSAKLTALLQSGAYWGKDTGMFARLAKVVIKVLEDALKGTSNLSPCVKDIPAVLLALASTYCPASGSLYNPYTDNSTECKYIAVSSKAGSRCQLGCGGNTREGFLLAQLLAKACAALPALRALLLEVHAPVC